MALITCPECGKEISTKASVCVHCGFPINSIDNTQKMKSVYIFTKDRGYIIAKKDISLAEATEYKNDQERFCSGNSKIVILDAEADVTEHYEEYQRKVVSAQVRCPRCGSTSISTGARGVNKFWGFIGASKTVNRCAKCGHMWEPKG